jgi:hypothetical protein
MSGSPKYSSVDLSAQRRAEAAAAAAAERRRREAEAERRRKALEAEHARRLQVAKDLLERRQARTDEARERQEAVRQAQAEAREARAAARAEAAQARTQEAIQADAEPATVSSSQVAAASASVPAVSTPAPLEPTWLPPGLQGSSPDMTLSAEPGDRLEAEPANVSAMPPVDPRLVARALDLRAGIEMLTAIDLGANSTELAARLTSSDAELARLVEDGSEEALAAAVDTAASAFAEAGDARDAFVEMQARRRIIATAIVRALPDRYVVDAVLTEDADGAVRFVAAAPDETLRVVISGDPETGGDVIGYQTQEEAFEQRLELGEVVSDCPDLANRLTAIHEQIAGEGITAGRLHWRNQPVSQRDHQQRARRSTRTKGQDR